jgi:hypothetical protein
MRLIDAILATNLQPMILGREDVKVELLEDLNACIRRFWGLLKGRFRRGTRQQDFIAAQLLVSETL